MEFSPSTTIFAIIRAVFRNFLGIPFLCWSPGEPPYRECGKGARGLGDNTLAGSRGVRVPKNVVFKHLDLA